ncbi:MAG: DUF2029 domain-containing protein, partial [Acidobacteriaceae bacterium]|nr:DUF2029 domain-containing protein [Acidobacteriaceae bacterium]
MTATAQVASAKWPANPPKASPLSVLESLLVTLLAALAGWRGLLPGWRAINTDFPNYYVAARLVRSHYCLDRLYDWIWFQRIAARFGVSHQLVGFLGLTPFSALPLVPLSWLPVLAAKRVWLVFNVALLAGVVHLLSRQCGSNDRRTWLIALCAVIPLRTSFEFGQMHILVLALLAAAYLCHMRGRQIGSGCCIAVAAALKVYPIFFCIYFVVKRRWKALTAAVLFLGLCLVLSYLTAGSAATNAYLFQQLPRSLQGESGNPFLPTLTSSSALFHRLFLYEPELNPRPLISSPALYALLYPLWQAILAGVLLSRMRNRFVADTREALEWSAFVFLLMFLSSAPASYQFVVLIAAAVPTIAILSHQRKWRAAVIFFSLYLAACNSRTISLHDPPALLLPLLYLKLWSGVALIAFYCWILKPSHPRHSAIAKSPFASPGFSVAAVVLCLWIPSALSAWSHLRRMHPPIPITAVNRDSAYMRLSPVSTDAGLLYVAMEPDGYRVRTAETPLPDNRSNQLSFAATRAGNAIWIETASEGVPRSARITSSPNCAIDNAETPSLSEDNSILAFVREDHGRGGLWALDTRHCDDPVEAQPVRITPPEFDVRTVSPGANNTFLISSVYGGLERVFVVEPGGSPTLLAEAETPLDSPALSPDGKVIAVRELIAGRWQLMLL